MIENLTIARLLELGYQNDDIEAFCNISNYSHTFEDLTIDNFIHVSVEEQKIYIGIDAAKKVYISSPNGPVCPVDYPSLMHEYYNKALGNKLDKAKNLMPGTMFDESRTKTEFINCEKAWLTKRIAQLAKSDNPKGRDRDRLVVLKEYVLFLDAELEAIEAPGPFKAFDEYKMKHRKYLSTQRRLLLDDVFELSIYFEQINPIELDLMRLSEKAVEEIRNNINSRTGESLSTYLKTIQNFLDELYDYQQANNRAAELNTRLNYFDVLGSAPDIQNLIRPHQNSQGKLPPINAGESNGLTARQTLFIEFYKVKAKLILHPISPSGKQGTQMYKKFYTVFGKSEKFKPATKKDLDVIIPLLIDFPSAQKAAINDCYSKN